MIKSIDSILCTSFGDSGKREISYQLNKRPEYDVCLRVQGGANSGGVVHYDDLNGSKGIFKLNQIPTGIFHGKKCIIGSGCVLNVEKFFKELQDLNNIGVKTDGRIFIAKNTHIITKEHIEEDSKEEKIGSTKQGISQCYRDKYAKVGIRAESIEELKPYLIDLYDVFFNTQNNLTILVEMAQGYRLSIDDETYPFVTSSYVSIGSVLLNTLPWNKLRKVYGTAKAYDTYVGKRQFQPEDPIFNELQEIGSEIGVISGRKRQCNWLDIDSLQKAINVNCVTHLIISKLDVLEKLNELHDNKYWNLYSSKQNKIFNYKSKKDFCSELERMCGKVQFRSAPDAEVYI